MLEDPAKQAGLDRILMLRDEEFQNGHVQCNRNSPEQKNGNVSFARFQLTEGSLRNIRVTGKLFPTDYSALTNRANPLSQGGQEFTLSHRQRERLG